jgi:hypothetical protein
MIRVTGLNCREEDHHVGPGQVTVPAQRGISNAIFFSYVSYSTLLHLPTLIFHCVGGREDRTQNCCGFGTDMHARRSNHSA